MSVVKIFFITILLSPISCLKSMRLDDLPADIIGKTVVQLVETVGTLAIKNEADIPVIVKYAKGLSLVNKKLYKKCNEIEPSSMFIEAVSERFGMDQLTVVGRIRTPGGKEWLKKYVETTGEYEQFKSLQQIFDIAQELCTEFKLLGVDIRCKKNDLCPASNQTEQGFFICCPINIPCLLYTPWGAVHFLEGEFGLGFSFATFCQSLFKRFKISLSWMVVNEGCKVLTSQEIDLKALLIAGENIQNDKDIFRRLSSEELFACTGKDIIVFNGNARYKLLAIDGHQLAEPEKLLGQSRNDKAIKLIWNILQERYNKEKGIVITEKNEQKECNKDAPDPHRLIKSITTASEQCVQWLELLENEPDEEAGSGLMKRLLLKSKNDCDIIDILCKNADKKLEKKALNVTMSTNCLDSGSCGIMRYKDKYNGFSLCQQNLIRIKKLFDDVIRDSSMGWKKSTLVEYPDIFFTQSEEEWYLVIKQKTDAVLGEEFFPLLFANATGLSGVINCDFRWKTPRGYESRDLLYLWIKKSSYDDVVTKLNLHITE